MSHEYAGIAANAQLKTKAKIHSYVDAFDFLVSKGWAEEAQLGSNVTVRDCSEYIAVVLYDTEIVRYYPDDTFSVDNGGFNTPTTSRRITQFTPYGWNAYHQRKQLGIWNPSRGADIHPATHDTRITP